MGSLFNVPLACQTRVLTVIYVRIQRFSTAEFPVAAVYYCFLVIHVIVLIVLCHVRELAVLIS